MSLASWFYKAFTPKQELLIAARNLISLIENDVEAAKLMAKLDGIVLEQDNANLVRTTYRRILKQIIDDWNIHQGNDEYKLKLHEIETPPTTNNDMSHTYQYFLKGKGINIAYRFNIDRHEANDLTINKMQEQAYRKLLLSLSKAGINALNPEVYSGMNILPQHYAFERQELHT